MTEIEGQETSGLKVRDQTCDGADDHGMEGCVELTTILENMSQIII